MAAEDENTEEQRVGVGVALGMSFGASIGTVVFAMTGHPMWIAICAGLGLSLGIAIGAAWGNHG